ncbi:adenylyltransferase/cytidyltransferase family protein [Heyndrickxia acidicola]|uniref:Adenylyltransferase/cytidyltransferase family protein n=1 Tax=Heyndrickxia acidicola TaxID=209389 RepID=A0ABU6MMK7_9BACI|nr:adenylyltransferase/cytidyltransferase family protein [Heyndrickxia acidicola]MED1205206.1 adenylyltransferase/cytidyltransferase family protein [Heyndrickxia acidicola]
MKQFKTGYTTGVFDLFHVGHLNILQKAKELCETLIVGVSTDELVVEYKGKKPVISHADRMAIVDGVRYVDRVVPQINRDKWSAWNELRFDAMFVGDDWKGTPLFNQLDKEFSEGGIALVYLPYTKGVSSTILRERVLLK